MEATWEVNPVTVNVVTDVFLLVMLVMWIKFMEIISALEIMKSLRKGSRIYSFETLGTLSHLRFGWNKFQWLKKNEGLTGGELTRWRFRNFVALATFSFSVILVIVHILIDYGLDFAFQTQESQETAKYQMIEFRPNSFFVNNMSAIENFGASVEGCVRKESSLACLERADAVQELIFANLQESMSFARMLYETPSIAQIDVLDKIEFEYISVDAIANTTLRSDCYILEQDNLLDYDGSIVYDEEAVPPCLLRGQWSRLMELDMRATKVTTSKPIGRSLGSELNLGDLSMSSSVDFISYENFKDNRQAPSSMRIEQIDSIGLLSESNKVLQVVVDSKVRYGGAGSQKLRLIDLTRREFGSFEDPEFTLSVLESATTSATSRCVSPLWEKEGAKSLDLPIEVVFGDTVCSYQIRAVVDNCFSYETIYAEEEGGGATRSQEMGFQKVEAVILMSDGDACGERAKRKYIEQFTSSPGSDRIGLVLSIQFEIICTRLVEDSARLDCLYGPQKVFYDGTSFQVEKPGVLDGFAFKRIRLRSVVAWTAWETEGGDEDAIQRVKQNVREIFEEHYPTLRVLSNRGVMRGLVLGAKMNLSLRDIIAALSSQIVRVERDVALTTEAPVTKLGVPYFVGLGIVVGFNVIAGVFIGIRSLQENREYRSLSMVVKVPTTRTSWIQAALVTKNGLQRENLTATLTFECRKGSIPETREDSGTRTVTTVDTYFEDGAAQ